MKTNRIVQFLYVRDLLKIIPDIASLTFPEVQERLVEKKPPKISLARFTAMVISFSKGNTNFGDAD